MAGATRSWIGPLALAALFVCAHAAVLAQSPLTGALAGKLTDLHSIPVGGAAILLRNQATGEESRATTQKNGAFRFAVLQPGDYTLEAESPQLGRGRVESIEVDAGSEARVQSAIDFQLPPPQPSQLVFHRIDAEPPVLTASLTSSPLLAPTLPSRPIRQTVRVLIPTTPLQLTSTVPPETIQSLPIPARSPRPAEPQPASPTPAPQLAAVHPQPPTPLAANPAPPPTPAAAPRIQTAPSTSPVLASLQSPAQVPQAALLVPPPVLKPVLAAAAKLNPATPLATTTLSGDQIHALPVTGRRWQDFLLETPTASTSSDGEISLRGAGQQSAGTAIDGVNTTLAFGGRSGHGGGFARGASIGGPGIGEAAIREVQYASGNVQAEAERAAGGRVNVETHRGANGLHGQGFLFDRQNTWGARNPFTQWVRQTAPATQLTIPTFTAVPYTPPDHEITWGVGLGSHIRRNKLFWFAALDAYQRNDPGLATVKHPDQFFLQPSNDQMQVLSARLGLSSANPVAAGLAAYSPELQALAGLLGPAPRTATQWTGFARLDWLATERHRFTLEGTGANWDSAGGGFSRVSETYGTHSFGSTQAREQWLLARWEAFLTPNLMAVTQASAGHTVLSARSETPSAFEQPFLAPNVWGQLPQMVVDSRYGFTIGNPVRFGSGNYPDEHLYQGQELVDYVRGNLLIKSGFNFSHNADATSLLRNQTGAYHYAHVENFISDALAFAQFGIAGEQDPANQHSCDQTGKVWRDSTGQLRGLGSLPCYSYYSQTLGPTNWHLSTNDWAAFTTAQWQPNKRLALSAGLRWERQQLPPPIAAVDNPELPLTQKLPNLGNSFNPRFSLAWGTGESHWPVLRLGYGMYAGRTENDTVEAALSQTGSLKGDLNFFMRPLDGFNSQTKTSNAPPFPYVLAGDPPSVIKPAAIEFAPNYRNPQIHQAVAGVEESLPGHVTLFASGVLSLARRLPISIDTNFDPAVNPGTITYGVIDPSGKGPIKATQITVPFYASWPSATGLDGRLNPDYQQVIQIMSRANSTYEAAMLRVSRNARRGLSLHAHYTYAHAMDWNPNESSQLTGSDVLDPADFSKEYGTSNLDVRHSASAMVIYEAPWKLRGFAGRLANGWMLSAIGQFRSGRPYTMRTAGSLPEEFLANSGEAIVGLGPGINGSGGDSRVYGLGNDNVSYNIGRNTFRYPSTWKADMRLGKRWSLPQAREIQLIVESFNLFNHQNVTELETVGYSIEPGSLNGALPTLNFLTGLKANTTEFGQPLNINATNFYRERQFQAGLRMRF